MAEITDVLYDLDSAEVYFNREELEMLHNVLGRVQCGMSGYGKAASDVLGVLDRLFGEIDETDHHVEMHTRYGHSLYWGPENSLPF